MLQDICSIIVGIALVLIGATYMTNGAGALARRMNVSELVIGLTIVAAGTSAPELFISVLSAMKGTADIALGNVIGSNIFNTLLIVGCSALVAPMAIAKSTVRIDIPVAVFASLLLIVLCMDGFSSFSLSGKMLSRIDGIILLMVFAAYMAYVLKTGKDNAETGAEGIAEMGVFKSIVYLLFGLAWLIFGSNQFVDSASSLASSLGVSDAVIGLTIVAGGTSLPELATSVVAARNGRSAMAIGNVLGSNVFNILLILGCTSAISPMQIQGITLVDILTMGGSVMLLWLFSFTKYKVERWEGGVLCVVFAAYMAWLLANI
ncbi:MAG: calcium/sodium antiporter [Prevotella sp.]|nr:calcium/sodium antiporter [Prevotella sp.]